MPRYDFYCFASGGKGDSIDWTCDFQLSDEEVERILGLHVSGGDDIFDYPEIADIADRIYDEMLVIETDNCLNYSEDLIRDHFELQADDEITPDQAREYLEDVFVFAIRFPDELVNEETEE